MPSGICDEPSHSKSCHAAHGSAAAALPGGLIRDDVRVRVEQAEKRRDESLGPQVLAKLPVDLLQHFAQARAQANADAQHRAHLRDRQRRPHAVTCGIGEQQDHRRLAVHFFTICEREGDEIVNIAARLLGGQ